MSSVAQIVQKIIDDLSDGISQLVLLVVVLQEQNAAVPPQLPQASQVVIKTAQTLVKIARNLADNNYKQFPDIQKEIHDAANAVDVASNTMTNAVNTLSSTSDRKSGWSALVDACRVMSGKTIRLLQIVYGAEMKRLFATAEQLLDGFDDLDVNQALTDPQAYADKASDMATKCANLAKYVEDRAKEEEAPGTKQKLMDQAKKLRDGAQALINDVNDLLADPKNPAKQKKTKDRIDGLKDLIKDAKKTVADNRTDIPQAKDLPSAPHAKSANTDPLNDIDKLKKILDKAEQGAKAHVPQKVREASDAFPPAARNVLKSGGEAAKALPTPQRKKQAEEALAELDKIMPQEVKSFDNYNKQPNHQPNADNVIDDAQDTKDILDDLARALKGEKEDPIDAIDKLARNLDRLDNGARNDNPPRFNNAANHLPRLSQNAVRAAKDAAQGTKTPNQKKQILDAIDRLEKQLPKENKAVNNLAQKPKDAPAKDDFFDENQETKDILDDLRNALLGDPLAAIDKLLKDMDKIEQAAKRGDAPKVKKIGDSDVPPHGRDCVQLCRDAANKTPNPDQRKRINDCVDKLDAQLPKDKQSIDNFAKQPAVEPAKKKLLDDADTTKKILEDLKRALLGLDPDAAPDEISPLEEPAKAAKGSVQRVADTAKNGDKPRLPKAVEDARKDIDELKKSAKDAADRISDPVRKQQIFDTLDDLDTAFPRQVAKARDTVQHHDQPHKVKELQDATDAVKDLIEELLDETTPPTLQDNANQAQKKLQDLTAAKQAGNEPEVQKLRNEIDALVGKVGDQAKHIAANTTTPQHAKDVMDAIKDLDNKMGNLNKDVIAKQPPPKIKGDADNVKGALQNIVDKTNADPLAAIDRLLKTLGKVDNASKAEDKPKLKKSGTKVAPQGKDVVDLSRQAAKKCPDPDQKKRINDCVDDVAFELPHELDAIKKNLDKIADPVAKKNLKDETDDTVDLLNALKNALLGKPPPSQPKAVGDVMDAVNQLNNIAPQLDDVIKHIKDSPNDPQNPKKLAQLAKDLETPFQQLHDAILDPEDEVPYAAEALKQAVDKLKDKADRGDGKGAVQATKELMDAKKDLVDKLAAAANQTEDPEQKKDLLGAAKEVEKLLPALVNAAKDSLENPKDPAKQLKLHDAARALKKAADRAAEASTPKNDEKMMRDAEERAKDAIARIRAAAQKGDKPGMQKGFRDLKKAGDDFQKAYRRRRGPINFLPKGDEEDPLAELKKLWDKFGVNRDKLLEDPKNPKNLDNFNNWADKLKKVQDKAMDDVGAKKVAPIQDVEDAIKKLEDGVRRADPQGVTQAAKDLVDRANKLNNLVAAEPDAGTKQKLQKVLAPVKDLIADTINKAKDALQDPNNPDKKKKVKEAGDRLRHPLAQAKNIWAPEPAKEIEEKVAKAKADNADVKDALRGGDPNRLKDAINKLGDSLGNAGKQLKKAAGTAGLAPWKKQQLQRAGDNLDNLADKVKKAPLTDKLVVEDLADHVGEQLDNVLQAVDADEKDELIRAKAKAKSIMASIKATADDMDPMSLLECAQDLSGYLNSMMNLSMDWAKNQADEGPLTDKARAALDLDDLLRQIENTKVDDAPVNTESLDALLASLSDLNEPSAPVPQVVTGTFEDVVAEVAIEVKKSVEKHKGNKESKDIADALQELANAARSGKRQQMIVAGRAVAAHIQQFIKQLSALADRVSSKNPMYQDRLIRYTHTLKNYATQMKIMISVKASSIERDADADESLASITRGLGQMMTEALNTTEIVKVTILKEPL